MRSDGIGSRFAVSSALVMLHALNKSEDVNQHLPKPLSETSTFETCFITQTFTLPKRLKRQTKKRVVLIKADRAGACGVCGLA